MRFLADECVSHVAVARLRGAGVDVTVIELTDRGSPDELVLAIAASHDRVLITEDRDFGDLVIRKRLPVRGIVLLELDALSNEAEAERLLQVVSTSADQLEGNLTVVEPSRTRVRRLPERIQ